MEKIVEKVLRDTTPRMRLGGGGVYPLYKDRSTIGSSPQNPAHAVKLDHKKIWTLHFQI